MKLYFAEKYNETRCYTIEFWLYFMKEWEIQEMKLFEAKIIRKSEFFMCNVMNGIGKKGNCGKWCGYYRARNGISGICKHNYPAYEPTDKAIIIKND